MKKLLLATILFVASTLSLSAQYAIENLSMSYGDEIKDNKNKIVKIIGEANGKIYALALKKKDFSLKIFGSEKMNVLSESKINIPDVKDREVDFENIFLLNGKLYVIGSVYDKKQKIFRLVGTEVSEKGVLSSKNQILFEAEVESKSKRGNFYFRQSNDEGALLIMHTSLFAKEDAVKYEVKLFDDALTTLFNYSEKVKFDDSKKKDYEFLIADMELNFQDDVFLVINESYRDSKAKEKIEHFEVHAFKKANNYQKEVINIDLKGNEIINCRLLSTNKNTLQLVGFYSSVRPNGKANKELKGIYNANINLATNQNENLVFNEFDYETKVKLIGERRAKKGRDVAPIYDITNIIEKNDGGLIVLSEYQLIVVGQSSGIGPLAFTPVTYIKNEIIVTSLKPDGSLEWSNVVAKDQDATVTTLSFMMGAIGSSGNFTVGMAVAIPLTEMGKGPEYLGAIPIYADGQLHILFNDNKKNKGITDIEKIKNLGNYNNAVPTLFSFDNNGQITRKDPEEVIKNELVIRPGVYYRNSAKEYIIYASRKKQNKLGRMSLNL